LTAFRDDRDALLARNDALQDELEETQRELTEARAMLDQAQRARSAPPAQPKVDETPRPNRTQRAVERVPTQRPSAGIVRRVLSVFGRVWVIVLFGMPAFIALLYLVIAPSSWPTVVAGLGGLATVVVLVDGVLRRCRRCRRWLGAKQRSQMRTSHATRVVDWQCYFCGHNWQTTHAVTHD
jgi:hypothetical protein